MRRSNFGGMGAGSILMIFVVLILTTFGLLSWVSAHADLRMTRKQLTAQEQDYAADAKADIALAEIDASLAAARADVDAASPDAGEDYIDQVQRHLPDAYALDIDDNGSMAVSVEIAVGDQRIRTLKMRLLVLPLNDPARYEVLSRQMITVIAVTEDTQQGYLPPLAGNEE